MKEIKEIVLVHNHYDKEHLEEVKKEMLKKGSPIIRAVYIECEDRYYALEGCHRLRAAARLGIPVKIKEIEFEDIMDVEVNNNSLGLDLDCQGTFSDLFERMLDRKSLEVYVG